MPTITQLDLTILYVEDEEDTREEVANFLELRVKKLFQAKNGKEGLEQYKQFHPDLVISDIKMPQMNGIEMAREIKSINKKVPIIITTAYNETDFLIASIDIGINQFVVKPVIFEKLLEAIQKCLAKD